LKERERKRRPSVGGERADGGGCDRTRIIVCLLRFLLARPALADRVRRLEMKELDPSARPRKRQGGQKERRRAEGPQ